MSFSVVGNAPIDGDELDKVPPLDSVGDNDPGYDPEAPYGRTKTGRIRKRPVGSTRRGTGNRLPASDAMARKAAAVLAQGNAVIAMGAMMANLFNTAKALSDEERTAVFEEQAYQALLTDPALCRTILRAGATSGKAALIVAYGMYLGSVAPVAFMEIKAKREAETDDES